MKDFNLLIKSYSIHVTMKEFAEWRLSLNIGHVSAVVFHG